MGNLFKGLLLIAFFFRTSFAAAQWGEDLVASYSFRGFSADGKYAAFEMEEPFVNPVHEFTKTSIFIIDVDKNSYAARHFEFDRDSVDQPGFATAYEAYNKSVTGRFGISGNNLGTPIAFDAQDTTHSFVVNGEKYNIGITLLPVPASENDSEVMVKVDLLHGGKVTTLQAPQKAPDSWGVTIDYSLLSAYTIKNKIAIFLQMRSSEIESRDRVRQMIVTGALK